MPQGSGQQWRQLSWFPSPAPWLSSRCTSVWWKAARRHSRSLTHFWSTSRATRKSWATAATSVARTFPHCMTWVCTSIPTASCHSTAPRRMAPSISMCPSTSFSCREPRGLQPWWFWWLRTSETPQRGNWISGWGPAYHSGFWALALVGMKMVGLLIVFFHLADFYSKKILIKGNQYFLIHSGEKALIFFSPKNMKIFYLIMYKI